MGRPSRFQVALYAALINAEEKMLLVRGYHYPNEGAEPVESPNWMLPGGRAKPDETAMDTLYAKIYDTVGLSQTRVFVDRPAHEFNWNKRHCTAYLGGIIGDPEIRPQEGKIAQWGFFSEEQISKIKLADNGFRESIERAFCTYSAIKTAHLMQQP